MERMQMLSALAALNAGFVLPPGVKLEPDDFGGSRGHVCGRDRVKDAKRKQPRNQSCLCGSGVKAKRCCVWEVTDGR